jgi:hypothetical protein
MLNDTVGERRTQGEQRVRNEKRTLPFSRAVDVPRAVKLHLSAGIPLPRIILDDAQHRL